MARTILINCEGLESEKKKKKRKHARPLEIATRRLGAVHSVALTSFFSFSCGSCEKICFGNWFAHGEQTAAEEPSKKCVVCRHKKMGRGGRLTFRKSEHQPRHSHSAHWLSRWPAGLVRGRSGPSGIEELQQNQTSEGLSWATMQVAVGLWVGMYGYFSLSTNRKACELC